MANFSNKKAHELDLVSLREIVPMLPSSELDRDFNEISYEVSFLENQVKADLARYTLKQLQEAYEEIEVFKQRSEILKIELDKRNF